MSIDDCCQLSMMVLMRMISIVVIMMTMMIMMITTLMMKIRTPMIIMRIMILMIRKPGQQDWCPDRGLSHCCGAIQEKELGPDRHQYDHDDGRHVDDDDHHNDDDDDCDDDDDDEDSTHTAICAALTAPSRVRARHCRLPPANCYHH